MRELGPEASRRLLVASGIEEFLVDTGPSDPRLCSAAEVADLAGGTAHEVLRLETLAEDLLGSGVSAAGLPDRIEQELSETTAVALKSVAAYRVGLDLPVVRPSRAAVVRGFEELVRSLQGTGTGSPIRWCTPGWPGPRSRSGSRCRSTSGTGMPTSICAEPIRSG